MKIRLEPTNLIKHSNYIPIRREKDSPSAGSASSDSLPASGLSLANFPNVSFKMNPDAGFLISQCRRLKCAYSGRKMIPPNEAKTIYAKLQKRPNAQSAINFLIH